MVLSGTMSPTTSRALLPGPKLAANRARRSAVVNALMVAAVPAIAVP